MQNSLTLGKKEKKSNKIYLKKYGFKGDIVISLETLSHFVSMPILFA